MELKATIIPNPTPNWWLNIYQNATTFIHKILIIYHVPCTLWGGKTEL